LNALLKTWMDSIFTAEIKHLEEEMEAVEMRVRKRQW
jgi:hypothetical protein